MLPYVIGAVAIAFSLAAVVRLAILTAGTCYCDQPDCGGGCSPKPSCWSASRPIGPQERAENDCGYCAHLPTCNARHAAG